jgi:hypothetical protein
MIFICSMKQIFNAINCILLVELDFMWDQHDPNYQRRRMTPQQESKKSK